MKTINARVIFRGIKEPMESMEITDLMTVYSDYCHVDISSNLWERSFAGNVFYRDLFEQHHSYRVIYVNYVFTGSNTPAILEALIQPDNTCRCLNCAV